MSKSYLNAVASVPVLSSVDSSNSHIVGGKPTPQAYARLAEALFLSSIWVNYDYLRKDVENYAYYQNIDMLGQHGLPRPDCPTIVELGYNANYTTARVIVSKSYLKKILVALNIIGTRKVVANDLSIIPDRRTTPGRELEKFVGKRSIQRRVAIFSLWTLMLNANTSLSDLIDKPLLDDLAKYIGVPNFGSTRK